MAREYELSGESLTLYNGAQDTEGGIWVRIRDEDDRRLLAAAVSKQMKNQEAAKGTLSALDPNSGHLLDYIADALRRVLDGINGARPSTAQLDGTPMGRQLASENADVGSTGDGKKKRGRKKGEPTKVGDVLAQVAGGPLESTPGGIQWADNVPTPRPEPSQLVRTAQGQATSIDKVIGFDPVANAFRVIDASGWDGLVFHDPTRTAPGEWWIFEQVLDYPTETIPEPPDEPEPYADVPTTDTASPTPPDTPPDAVPPKKRAAKKAPTVPDAAPSPQRARNAKSAGVGKPTDPRPAGKRAKLPKKKR